MAFPEIISPVTPLSEKSSQPMRPQIDFLSERIPWYYDLHFPPIPARSQVIVSLSTELVSCIEEDLMKEINLSSAFWLYSQGMISAVKAAALNGMNYVEFLAELNSRGIRLPIGPESIEEAEQESQRFLERE